MARRQRQPATILRRLRAVLRTARALSELRRPMDCGRELKEALGLVREMSGALRRGR